MSEKILIIHAGGSKTGTSALQHFFKSNVSQLETLGLAYLSNISYCSDREINSGNGFLLVDFLSSTNSDSDLDRRVLSYFGQCSIGIISSEYFSELSVHGWKRLYESTIRLGVTLKIIFYVRNVIPYMLSAYDQVIKHCVQVRVDRKFDQWALNRVQWQHFTVLSNLKDILPKENIRVLHYESNKKDLILSFLAELDIVSSFDVNQFKLSRQVNRSLNKVERKILIFLNENYSREYANELSYLFITKNPTIRSDKVSYNVETKNYLVERFNNQVEWINEIFFNRQSIVSVLPVEVVNKSIKRDAKDKFREIQKVKNLTLLFLLEKLKTIKKDTEQNLLASLCNASQYDLVNYHTQLPVDFDPVTYLLINKDVLFANADPVQHYINFGQKEGRSYKFGCISDIGINR